MKRFFKWFFGILVFLIILLVIAAVTLPYYFDPNKYKADIIAQIKPYMHGRDLKIPGKIKLSVFPWLGVQIGKTVVGNADGFVLKPFMTIDHARAHVRLLSLLTDTPEIGSLEFNGVVLNLKRDAEGRNNWSDLFKTGKKAGLHKTALTTTSSKPAAVIPKLKVDGIHFKDVRINFQDDLNKNDITISKLNLNAGPINQFQPVPLSGNLDYASKTQGLDAASAFATILHVSPDAKSLSLQKLAINTNLAGKALKNKTMVTALTVPNLQIDLAREKIDTQAFHLSVDKMQSDGHLSLRKFSHPIIRFGLDMKTLDLDKLLPAPAANAPVAPVPTTTGTAVDTSPAIFAALMPLKTANIQGTLNVNKLLFKHLQFDQTSVAVIARSGLISAQPQAKLYNGTYQGDIQINVSHSPVHLTLRQQLQHVSMGPITLALTGKKSMTGTANIQGQFVSQGNTLEQVTRQLNGDASFNIRNVQLTLMDVEQLVLQKWYDKLKLAQKQQQGKKVTAFDSMRGSIRIENGIAYNHDFTATSQRVHLTGSGQANLVNHTMNYTLVTIPQTSLAIQVSGTRYDLRGKHIPTTIRGPWANPDIKNGLQDVIKADLNTAVEHKKQQAEDKLKSRIQQEKNKLQDKLKGLLH